MRKTIFTIATYFIAVTIASSEPITVSEALKIKENASANIFAARAEWNALTFYLQGLVEGAASYQEILINNGKKTLFCPPKGKSYSLEELFENLERSKQDHGNHRAATVIMEAYAKEYPCKK